MGNVTIEFKYGIGDRVANILSVKEMELMCEFTDQIPRPLVLRVEERLAYEDGAGIKLFYACRTVHGYVEKHPENELVRAEELWDAWVNGMRQQSQRHKENSDK